MENLPSGVRAKGLAEIIVLDQFSRNMFRMMQGLLQMQPAVSYKEAMSDWDTFAKNVALS